MDFVFHINVIDLEVLGRIFVNFLPHLLSTLLRQRDCCDVPTVRSKIEDVV